jgi:hypothetical protein
MRSKLAVPALVVASLFGQPPLLRRSPSPPRAHRPKATSGPAPPFQDEVRHYHRFRDEEQQRHGRIQQGRRA